MPLGFAAVALEARFLFQGKRVLFYNVVHVGVLGFVAKKKKKGSYARVLEKLFFLPHTHTQMY